MPPDDVSFNGEVNKFDPTLADAPWLEADRLAAAQKHTGRQEEGCVETP